MKAQWGRGSNSIHMFPTPW